MKNRIDARKTRETRSFLTAKTLVLAGLAMLLALGISSLALYSRTAATQELDKNMPNLSGDAAVEFLKSRSEYDSLRSAFQATVDDDSNSPSATTRITASDGMSNNLFGNSVAISGDTAIIGAPTDRPLPQFLGPGAAYIFVRNGTGWTQQQKLSHVNPNCNCRFGISVGVSEDTVIVGSQGLPTFGLAFVYVRSGTTWSLQQTLSPPSGNSNEPRFGLSVAISGETVVVGAHTESTSGSRSGAAYVFVRSGTNWGLQQRLTASDAMLETQFGRTLAIDGDQAIIGALCGGFIGGCRPGAAYVFVRNETTWTQQQKLTPSDGANSDQFSSSVALSGNTALIGAWQDDIGPNSNQGSAYVFTRNGTSWTQEQKLTAPDGTALDYFGSSAGLDGGILVVGAIEDDIGANLAQGSAYVFNRCGPPNAPPVKITATIPGNVLFGSSLAVNGEVILVGAPGGDLIGSTYVFPRADIAFRGEAQCEVEIEVNITSDLADADVEDDVCDVDTGQSGQQCSLRAAIQTANAKDGPDEIKFDIPGSGTHSISPLTQLPSLTETVTIDATTQPGYTNSPLIEMVGTSTTGGLGFAAGSGNSTVKGLAINRFAVAIGLSSGGNRIEKCYIGLSPNGTAAGMPGAQQVGISIQTAAATNNIIGGAGDLRNVISNNTVGIGISQGASGNKVFGNRIGTNVAGTSAIPNDFGVAIESANSNNIGDSTTQVGNLISGNAQFGVGLSTGAANNRIAHNLIGTKANGTEVLPNGVLGIFLQNAATMNTIDKNVLGGHTLTAESSGIGFAPNAGPANTITSNFIGVAADGTTGLPNTYGILNPSDAQVIGAQSGGNTIGFNEEAGIFITSVGGANAVVENNLIHYNFIGTNGTEDIGNSGFGVMLNGESDNNTVTRNTVSGNEAFGIALTDGPHSNDVSLNFVGTNATGTTAIPNGGGIWIRQATDNNLESNLVSGNSIGILVGTNIGFGPTRPFVERFKQHEQMQSAGGTFTTGNRLFGNVVGLNANRNAAIPGGSIGIAVGENARNNQIGTATGPYNLISGNTDSVGYGIFLGTLAPNPAENILPQSNLVQRNVIGLAGNLQTTIANKVGFVLLQAVNNTIGGSSPDLGNVIVGSTTDGLQITDGSRLNTIQNNRIGILPGASLRSIVAGRQPMGVSSGNGGDGIKVGGTNATDNQLIDNAVANNGGNGISVRSGASGTKIRGTMSTQARSVISYNGENGIRIESVADVEVLATVISRCLDAGARIDFSQRIKIGDQNQGNQIAGNGGDGIRAQQVDDIRVIANKIGMIEDEILVLAGNEANGINLISTTNAQIGDISAAKTNIIVLNEQYGMLVDQVTELVKVQNNLMGTTIRNINNRSGVHNRSEGQNLGNLLGGIRFSNGSRRNMVGGPIAGTGNVIANNGGPGVWIDETAGTGNLVDPNSIYGNAGPGIALGNIGHTPNDPTDADVGPNNLQNYPTFTLSVSGGNLIVNYQVDSAPTNSDYGTSGIYVEFFEADSTGAGQHFLGSDHYLLSDYTNGTPGTRQKNLGNAVALGITAGDLLTATATDAEGNSSEFTPTVIAPGGAPGFEGDVAPRPDGDGVMLSTDITQLRRFVSGLDVPGTTTNEIQRADCAPRSTFGDGVLTSSDVVQGRRYVAGLDPSTPSGGPASRSFISESSLTGDLSSILFPREMRVGQSTTQPGRVSVPIEMTSNGNETAMSFTIEYDANTLTNPRVNLGKFAPPGSTLTFNTNEPGRIGIVIDSHLPMNTSAMPKQLLTVTFDVIAGGESTTPVKLTSSLAAIGISNTAGNSLVATYADGVVRTGSKE